MAESDSDSSVEKFLNKSHVSFLNNELVGTASNISINISVPNAASSSSQSVLVHVGSDNITKKKMPNKTIGKSNKKGTKNISKIDEYITDTSTSQEKYSNLTPTELNNFATRIKIFHEMGVVAAANLVPCKNRYRTKRKKPQSLQQCTKVKKDSSRKANIGTTCESYGIKACLCCNVDKENLNDSGKNELQTNQSKFSKAVEEKLSTDALNRLKEREDRLVHLQQRQLLEPSEGTGSIAESEAVEPYIPELTAADRERIQAFVDSIDPHNYSHCTTSELNNSLENRLANSMEDFADSLHKKTILERIDFQKEQERRSRLIQTQFCSNNDAPVTSTPNFQSIQDDLPLSSIVQTQSTNNELEISGIERFEPEVENRGDFSNLDRSNITIRGVKNTHNSCITQSNREISVNSNGQREENIMEFVNDLLGTIESQAISDEVEERFHRLSENRRTACDALSEAVNPIENAFEEEMMLDNSVEIVSVTSPLPIIIDSDEIVCLSNNDSDVEILQEPSTSTGARHRKRGKRVLNSTSKRKRQANQKKKETPIVQEKLELEKKGTSSLIFRDCPICLEEITNQEISSTTCGHVFCTKCIKEVIKTSKMCPNCRTKLTLKKIHPLFV